MVGKIELSVHGSESVVSVTPTRMRVVRALYRPYPTGTEGVKEYVGIVEADGKTPDEVEQATAERLMELVKLAYEAATDVPVPAA